MTVTVDIDVTTHLRWGCGYASASVEGWPVGRWLVLFGFIIPLGFR